VPMGMKLESTAFPCFLPFFIDGHSASFAICRHRRRFNVRFSELE
jgi:hypothetical protein